MATQKIYAVCDDGKWIGSYTSDAAAKLLGIPRGLVSSYASSGVKALKRYTFQVVADANEIPGISWEDRWDLTRLRLLEQGRKRRDRKNEQKITTGLHKD